MHAVVVKLTIDDVDRDDQLLEEQVVPRASGAAGFVAGYWTRSGDSGLSMVLYESEEARERSRSRSSRWASQTTPSRLRASRCAR